MKNIKLLTTLKVFFQKIKVKWKPILIVSAILLLISSIMIALVVDTKTLFYKIVFAIFVLSIFALVTLLFSFIIVPILDFKIRGARAWFNWSSSRMLPASYRLKVWSGLNELKNYSDYRFFNQSDTYIRVQLISKYSSFQRGNVLSREAFATFPTPDLTTLPCVIKYNNGTEDEIFTLLVESKTYDNGKVEIIARWISKENPSTQEINAAETVMLIKDEPTLLTYGFNRVNQNGDTEEVDEVILTVTWIGGNM